MSQYTLLACKYEDDSENDLLQIGYAIRKALHTSDVALAKNPHKIESMIDVKVLFYDPILVRLGKSRTQRIPEFEVYSKVWFLNEAAIQLCEENQISLKILKKIEESDLSEPEHLGVEVHKPYLPKHQR